MSFFAKKDSSIVYGALLDIRSGSIGIGITESKKTEELPMIIFESRTPLQFQKTPDNRSYFEAIKITLPAIERQLKEEGHRQLATHNPYGEISHLLVTCSAPWSRTITRTISYTKDEPFKITSNLLADLAIEAEKETSEKIQESEIAHRDGFDASDRALMQVSVNGYAVTDPVGHRGTVLQFAHMSSLIAKDITSLVYNFTARAFPNIAGSLHAYIFILYSVIKKLYPHIGSFCIIDVSGEATEIAIVDSGVIRYSTFIPYGITTLIRNVGTSENASEHDTISHLRAYAEKTLSAPEQEKIMLHLKNYGQTLTEAVQKLHEEYFIPQNLVMSALPGIEHVLTKQIISTLTEMTNETHTVIELNKEEFARIAEKENDRIISVLAHYFHIEQNRAKSS